MKVTSISEMNSRVNKKRNILSENRNGNRHLWTVTNGKSFIQSANHKNIKRSTPSPQINDNSENSIITHSIKVNPDMTLRDILGAMTQNGMKPKFINEVSSEAALRKALGDDDDDDEGNIELKVTMKGTSISLMPILKSPVRCHPEEGIASKVTKRSTPTVQQKKSVLPKPILKKRPSVLPIATNLLKSSRKSSLSSCESSDFSLESEPPATKAYPKYFIISRRTSCCKNKCPETPIIKKHIKLETCKADSKTLELKKSRTTNENNALLPNSDKASNNKLIKFCHLLDHQQGFNELYTQFLTNKDAWIKFSDKEKQMLSDLIRTKSLKTECKSDKSLTSLESLNGEEMNIQVMSQSQINTSVFTDFSKKKRPAPSPPTNVPAYGIIKTSSAPSRQVDVRKRDMLNSWEYFDQNSNKEYRRDAPVASPPKKPFVSDLLSEGRKDGRIYSSKVVVAPRQTIEIQSEPNKMPLPTCEDKSGNEFFFGDKKKRPPPPPPRKINLEFGSQIYPIEPPINLHDDKKEKPHVSFADGKQILDEQWKRSIQEFNLSSHYKEQTNDGPPSQYKEQLNNSARQENGSGQTNINKTRDSNTSESWELIESNEAKPIHEVVEATTPSPKLPLSSAETKMEDKSQFVAMVLKKEKHCQCEEERNNVEKESCHVTLAPTKTTITFEEYMHTKSKLSTKNFHDLHRSSMSQFSKNKKDSNNEKRDNPRDPRKQIPALPLKSPPKSEYTPKIKSASRGFLPPKVKSSPVKVKNSSSPQEIQLKSCPPVTNLLELAKINSGFDVHNKSQNNGKESQRIVVYQQSRVNKKNKEITNHYKSIFDSPSKQFHDDNDATRTFQNRRNFFSNEENQDLSHHHHHQDRHNYHHHPDQYVNIRSHPCHRFIGALDDRGPGIELNQLLEHSNPYEINPRFSSIPPSSSSSIIARAIGSALNITESPQAAINRCKHCIDDSIEPTFECFHDNFHNSWTAISYVETQKTRSSASAVTSLPSTLTEIIKPGKQNRFSSHMTDKIYNLKEERHKLDDLTNFLKSKKNEHAQIFTDASPGFQGDFNHKVKQKSQNNKITPLNDDLMYHHHHHHNDDSFNDHDQFCDHENYTHLVDSRFSSFSAHNKNSLNNNNDLLVVQESVESVDSNMKKRDFKDGNFDDLNLKSKEIEELNGKLKEDDMIADGSDDDDYDDDDDDDDVEKIFFDQFDPFQDPFFSLNPNHNINTIYEESIDDDDDDDDDDSRTEEESGSIQNKASEDATWKSEASKHIDTSQTFEEPPTFSKSSKNGGSTLEENFDDKIRTSAVNYKFVDAAIESPAFKSSCSENSGDVNDTKKCSKVSESSENFEMKSSEHSSIQTNSFKSRVKKILQKLLNKDPTENKSITQNSSSKNSSDHIQQKTALKKQKTSRPLFFQRNIKAKQNISIANGDTKLTKSGKQSLRIFKDQSTIFSRFESKHKITQTTRKVFHLSDSYSPDISRFSPPPSEYSCQPPEIDLHAEMTFVGAITTDDPINPSFTNSSVASTAIIQGDLGQGCSFHSYAYGCKSSNKQDSLSPSSPMPLPRRSDLVLSISYSKDNITNYPDHSSVLSPVKSCRSSYFNSSRSSLDSSSDDTIDNTTQINNIENRKDAPQIEESPIISTNNFGVNDKLKESDNVPEIFNRDTPHIIHEIEDKKVNFKNNNLFVCHSLNPKNIQDETTNSWDPTNAFFLNKPPNIPKSSISNLTLKSATQPKMKKNFKMDHIELPDSNFKHAIFSKEPQILANDKFKMIERNCGSNLNLSKEMNDGIINKYSYPASNFSEHLTNIINSSKICHMETNNPRQCDPSNDATSYKFMAINNKSYNYLKTHFLSKINSSESSNSTKTKSIDDDDDDDDDEDGKQSNYTEMKDYSPLVGTNNLIRNCEILKENNTINIQAIGNRMEPMNSRDNKVQQMFVIDSKSIFAEDRHICRMCEVKSSSEIKSCYKVPVTLKSNHGITDITLTPSSSSSSISISSLESLSTSYPWNKTNHQPDMVMLRDPLKDPEDKLLIGRDEPNIGKKYIWLHGRRYMPSINDDDDDSTKQGVARTLDDLFMSPLKMPY